jgi:hypothetical protein
VATEEVSQFPLIKQQHKAKRKAPKKEPRNPYKRDKGNKILLTYPFSKDKDKIEAATRGLKEASGGARLVEVEEGEMSHVVA